MKKYKQWGGGVVQNPINLVDVIYVWSPKPPERKGEREHTISHFCLCSRPSVASPISLVRLRSSKHVDSLVKCTEFSLARSSAQVVLPRLIQVALLHKRLQAMKLAILTSP